MKTDMKKLRVFALIDLFLILVIFGIMIMALLIANYNLFFIAGGVLVALFIAALFLKQAKKQISLKEDAAE